MKDYKDLIVHKFDRDIVVYPISDVHFGSMGHNEKAWNEFVKYVAENENVYLTLGGDLINNGTRNSVSGPFDDTMRPREQKRKMADMLSPIRDRILCAIPGNHEGRSAKDVDDDPMCDIMCKLDLEDLYREEMAFVKIVMDNGKEAVNQYVLAVIHGAGAGVYTGATVNRNERFGNIMEGIDCLIVGHSHKPFVTKPQKLVVNGYNNQIKLTNYVVIGASSWLNYGGYAVKKMLNPASTSQPQKLLFEYKHRHHGKDIKVIW